MTSSLADVPVSCRQCSGASRSAIDPPEARRHTGMRTRILIIGVLVCCTNAYAKHDIEFVAEHLPEVAMDNRYATLPVWTAMTSTPEDGWTFAAQDSFNQASTGDLEVGGPLLSFAVSRALSSLWSVTALGF